MTEENVATALELLEAWNAEELERWLASWDESCVWVPVVRGRMEGGKEYRGHRGLRRYWAEDGDVWDSFVVEVHEVRTNGDEVVAITTGTARGKHSEIEVSAPMAFRFRVRDGRVVLGESYLDVEAALAAAGLAG
jgi:ketosteroid isomerase-like protein